jgi:hypothetical protein
MRKLSDFELGWVVGIIEGEGTIHIDNHQRSRGVIAVNMTDADTVYKLEAVTGIGRVYGPYTQKQANCKPYWRWAVSSYSELQMLLSAVKQHLGSRRSEQACALLTGLKEPRDPSLCKRGHKLDGLYFRNGVLRQRFCRKCRYGKRSKRN